MMPLRDLAAEVQSLIASLSSTEQLEVLLLMRRSPSEVYTMAALASELGLSDAVIATTLKELASRRLVAPVTVDVGGAQSAPQNATQSAPQVAYQYAPATVALHAAVEGLAIAMGTHSMAVIKALQDRPNRALRNFADAFRIRRDPSP